MTKEQLKAAIRKVLEKEGGAAGMKALKKQSDSSEEEIKASIKDDEKVGEHPDGDYILAKGKINISEIVEEEITSFLDEKRKKKKKKKGKKDACYHKVRARYDVWPSAYASGALVKCRKVGAANWGNKSKKNESEELDLSSLIDEEIEDFLDEKKKKTDFSKEKKSGLHGWFSRAGGKGKSKGWVDCNTCKKGKGGRKTCKSCGRKSGEKRAKYPHCRPTPSDCGTSKKSGKKSKAGKKG
jgi:hypothetical protein